MNKRLGVIAIGLITCFLMVGCAHRGNLFSKISGKAGGSQSDHQAMVCLLDPTLDAAVTAGPVAVPGDGRSPAVEIPETSFDFGQVSGERELVHTFNVKNVGTSVLSIKKVLPG